MNSLAHQRGDKLLFTPGPLTTSRAVKEAMLRDLGSRDAEFIEVVQDIRRRLVGLAGGSPREHTAILMQGSGTFGVESVISTTVPPDGKLLVIANGAYGQRIARMAEVLGIAVARLEFAENSLPDLTLIEDTLEEDLSISHVAVVHCETTSGIINPVCQIGRLARKRNCRYIVDAMSSFGAIPLNVVSSNIDYLISSANKCVEGAPGFSFVIARAAALHECNGWARSLSLDLCAQWRELERSGQFRFTPPTHALLAFHQALVELEEEGGILGRGERYHRNHQTLMEGMTQLGFRPYLRPVCQSYIITAFHYPDHPNFEFGAFYRRLNDKGFVIYPGKVGGADCFRIGTIGRLYEQDVRALLAAIAETLREMNVALRPRPVIAETIHR